MNCPLQKRETADLLLDYSARRLDAARAAALEQHMEQCAECARFRVEQKAVWDALDTWELPPVSVDFNRRLWRRIEAAANAPWYTQLAEAFRYWNWKPAIPLAAALLVIAGGFLLDHPGDQASAPRPALIQNVSATDADQLDRTLDDIQLLRQLDSVTPASGNAKQM